MQTKINPGQKTAFFVFWADIFLLLFLYCIGRIKNLEKSWNSLRNCIALGPYRKVSFTVDAFIVQNPQFWDFFFLARLQWIRLQGRNVRNFRISFDINHGFSTPHSTIRDPKVHQSRIIEWLAQLRRLLSPISPAKLRA